MKREKEAIDFEKEKVSVLFRKLLIPTLLGALSLSLVTVIDGIFIGNGVGAEGVAAINIAVPIYQIMAGLGLMVGAGCSVVASILLSNRKIKVARINITQATLFTSFTALLICIAVICAPDQTALTLGSSETLLEDVSNYLLFIMPCFFFEMWSLIGLFIIRLDGSPRYAMWCNILPAMLNVALDWLFIFPLGMGVKGAAIATSTSIAVGGVMALFYLLFISKKLRLIRLKINLKGIKFTLRNISHQCKIGSSTILGEISLAVLIIVGNITFMHYLGDDGVAAFGIACYYTPFFFSVGSAIAQSAQPIISYNYGIGEWGKIRESQRLLYLTAIICGAVVALFFFFAPESLVGLFVKKENIAWQLAVEGFPLYATGVIFFILNVAIIGYYQSIKKISTATIYLFLRGFLLLVPSFIFLPKIIGTEGIWLAMPLAEITTLIFFCIFVKVKNNID